LSEAVGVGGGSARQAYDAAETMLDELRDLERAALDELCVAECSREAAAGLLSSAAAAERIGVTAATVRARWKRGELRAYGSEAKLRFSWPDVLACFEVRPACHRDSVKLSQAAPRLSRRPARRFKQKVEQMRSVA
jgi:hypothetical protein